MAAPLGRKNCFSHPRDPPRRNAGLFLLYAVLSLLNKMGLGDIPRASSFLEGGTCPFNCVLAASPMCYSHVKCFKPSDL